MDAAFVALLHRRGYDTVRVTDIVRKSGVGRATFYAHYTSKHDLLRSQMDRLLERMTGPLPGEPCVLDATRLFAHTRDAAPLFRSLMSGRGRAVALASLEARIASFPDVAREPEPSLVARFVASALLGVLTWWLERGPGWTPAQMQAELRTLCGGRASTG